jgi:acetolactate synthase I/II/III large subunit
MFPGLSSVDVADIDALPAALERAMAVDGPSVVSVECSADEIPPFAAFLNRQPANQVVEQQITTPKENRVHVPASA